MLIVASRKFATVIHATFRKKMQRCVRFTLYSHWISTCSWRARLAFHYKKIPFILTTVDIAGRHEKSPAVSQNVPAVHVDLAATPSDRNAVALPQQCSEPQTGEFIIGDSLAIIELLESIFPDSPRLLGRSAIERARIIEAFSGVSDGQVLQTLRVKRYLQSEFEKGSLPHNAEERVKEWSAKWTHESLTVLERISAANSELGRGRFVVGDRFSAADCALIPHAFAARKRYNIDIASNFPCLADLLAFQQHNADENLHEALHRSHPMNQPDAPVSTHSSTTR